MPRGREPAGGAWPARERERARRLVAWAVLLGASACRGEGGPSGSARPGLVSPWSDAIDNVGNQVPGIEAMPDYDAEAQRLRTRVEPELPRPLPSAAAACTSMLDNARQYYVDVEGEGSAGARAMEATREADLAACERETSPAAATCVAVLMSKSEGEYPWLLDQCSRAFPRG